LLDKLKITIFADGADVDSIRELTRNPLVTGINTNPTPMRKVGYDIKT